MYSHQEIQEAVNRVFDEYKASALTMPFVVSVAIRNLKVAPSAFRDAEEEILTWLRGQVARKTFTIMKGASGGIFRATVPAQEHSIKVASDIAINDYVCPTCGNDHCSITETTCWKCGNPLH